MTENAKVNRTSRANETREATQRKKSWVRPSSLDAPEPPPGFKHRWLRREAAGIEDNKNIAGKLREGYELVRGEEYPDFVAPTMDNGVHAGVIGVGDVVLARVPDEIVEERNAYYQKRTSDQMEAADNDLLKANAHDTMRVIRPERQTRTTFGGPRKADD